MTKKTEWIDFGVIFLCALIPIFGAAPVDDTYISMRYAENFVEGSGLVWNPGFQAVEGYTNFLWVLMMAGASSLNLPIIETMVFFGVLSLVAIGFMVRWISRTFQ